MSAEEIAKLQTYLRKLFGSEGITLKAGAKADMADVSVKDEFIGVIYRDTDEGEVSYNFQMGILSIDLPE